MLKKAAILLALLLILALCRRDHNRSIYTRLQQWDSLLEEHPEAIHDSLLQLNPKELSRANRAYYGLLKTIADDKRFVQFTSDSLINAVHRHYHHNGKRSENHIRALTYLSIVRHRMGVADSTVFTPLKEAEQLYLKQKRSNPSTGYMLYYHLGDLLSNNNDFSSAYNYFNKALQTAKQERDSIHVFDTYLALFWNEMEQENYQKGKVYLDSAQISADESPDVLYKLHNAQATYFGTQNINDKKLEYTKKRFNLIPYLKETPQLFRLYYSLSDAYTGNGQADSSMYYAKLAIKHITDSAYKLNYLLYENVADIAEGQNNLRLALEYRQKAFEAYEKSIDTRLDTQIQELEKRYNLAEAENKALKAQKRGRIFTSVSLSLLLLLAAVIFDWNRRRKIALLEKNNARSKLRLARQQASENRRMINIVLPYLKLHNSLQQELLTFSNKIRAKDNDTADKYEQILKDNRLLFDKTTQQLFTDELLAETLKTANGLELLNETDRILLFMLAIGAGNEHIVALLNTTPANLKSKKSYLKKKIHVNASAFDNPEFMLSLF